MEKISIVIPVYNEEKTLPEIVKRVEASDTLGLKKEIIFIDDGSKDGTRDILKTLENRHSVLYHEKNQGKGRALIDGFMASTGDIILIQDADLEYNPDNYPELLKPIVENRAEVVYGSRYMKKNPISDWTYYFGARFINLFLNIICGSRLTDMWTCYKVFKTSLIKNLNLESNGFDIEVELTIKLLKAGHKILEIPIGYSPRSLEEGKKIRPKDGLIALWKILKYRFSN